MAVVADAIYRKVRVGTLEICSEIYRTERQNNEINSRFSDEIVLVTVLLFYCLKNINNFDNDNTILIIVQNTMVFIYESNDLC